MTFQTYRYKKRRPLKIHLNRNRPPRTNRVDDPEPLTGYVNGQQASDIEERFARALRKAGYAFSFQVAIPIAGKPVPKRLDFAVDLGQMQPVEVDGVLGHTTASEKADQQVREIELNQVFRGWGWRPLVRIPYWKLAAQELADRALRELF